MGMPERIGSPRNFAELASVWIRRWKNMEASERGTGPRESGRRPGASTTQIAKLMKMEGADVSTQAISNWLNNATKPDPDNAYIFCLVMARLLREDPDEFRKEAEPFVIPLYIGRWYDGDSTSLVLVGSDQPERYIQGPILRLHDS